MILCDASLQKAHLWPRMQMLEIISAYDNEKVVISDIVHVAECSNELCASLEAIKGGIDANKCESNMLEFPITHSVVSSNYPPSSLELRNNGTKEIDFRREWTLTDQWLSTNGCSTLALADARGAVIELCEACGLLLAVLPCAYLSGA